MVSDAWSERQDMVSDLVSDEGTLRIIKQCRPPGQVLLELTGEADLRAEAALCAVLAGLAAKPVVTDIHVDLSGLRFIDVAATRSLVLAAATLGPGRRMVVRGAPAAMRRTMEFCWADYTALEVSSG
ncbi:MAG: STAS domain-containing protein [Streptosporangiaceae bacterium]|nr:STAS domain-containing protein [Streptosporangiaceae bacterium]MBV9855907.1 STAS domain-containing protein [Streptosporangiaceae bacterium]